jgi:hypothetical protein
LINFDQQIHRSFERSSLHIHVAKSAENRESEERGQADNRATDFPRVRDSARQLQFVVAVFYQRQVALGIFINQDCQLYSTDLIKI